MFTVQSMLTLVQYRGTQFTTSIETGFYKDDFVFSEENGFQLAFGIVDMSHIEGYEGTFNEDLKIDDLFEVQISMTHLKNAQNATQ